MCGKLIDTDELKRRLYAFIKELVGSTTRPVITEESLAALAAYSLIDDMPAADAEPVRHGRWVKMTGMMPPEFHGHYECSECSWHLSGVRQTKNREEDFAYCPHCGAKMLECDADEKK